VGEAIQNGKIGEAKKRQKNLVKGVKTVISPQLSENAAKINFKKCPKHPMRYAILNL
jgi:hypothetical protein